MSQLNIPAKKPRFGPKVATSAWWVYRVDYDPFYQQPREHTDQSPEELNEIIQDSFWGTTLDYYELAGKHNYPPKGPSEAYWYKPIGGLDYFQFKHWAWIEATQTLDLPLSKESKDWYNLVTTSHFKKEAVGLLNKFFRPDSKKPLPIRRQVIKDRVSSVVGLIREVEFDIPAEYKCYTQLNSLNSTLKDTRSIPVTKEGKPIHSKFIKVYLEERLAEYLATGGLAEIILRSSLDVGNYQLPDPFYWDLWGNLNHLRFAYQEYQDKEHFNPEEEEDPLSSL